MRNFNIQIMNPDHLIPYARNAKTHPKDQIDKIAKQISEVGFLVPIVIDKEKVVIAGHGRLQAAKALGLQEVPVIVADHLTEDQAMAFRIADNKVAESPWDMQLLGFELKSLEMHDMDLTLSGFSMEEARSALASLNGVEPPSTAQPDFQPGSEDAQSTLDKKSPVQCPACGHEFSPGAQA
jgi:ParB-like chromosome segregation protein Spo0J